MPTQPFVLTNNPAPAWIPVFAFMTLLLSVVGLRGCFAFAFRLWVARASRREPHLETKRSEGSSKLYHAGRLALVA